jgi:hypothetical protein
MVHKILRLTTLILSFLFLLSCEEDTTELPDDRDAFIGSWNVNESCVRDSYTVQIVADPSNSSQVLINNFWNTGNCGSAPYAIIAGNNIVIPTQDFCDGAFEVNGDGDLDKGTISWNYTVNDGADTYSCQASYTQN